MTDTKQDGFTADWVGHAGAAPQAIAESAECEEARSRFLAMLDETVRAYDVTHVHRQDIIAAAERLVIAVYCATKEDEPAQPPDSPRIDHPRATRGRVDELTARLKRIPREAWAEAVDCNDETVAFRAIAMTLIDWEDESVSTRRDHVPARESAVRETAARESDAALPGLLAHPPRAGRDVAGAAAAPLPGGGVVGVPTSVWELIPSALLAAERELEDSDSSWHREIAAGLRQVRDSIKQAKADGTFIEAGASVAGEVDHGA